MSDSTTTPRMWLAALGFGLMSSVAFPALSVAAGGTLSVVDKAPFAKGLDVRPAIRGECKLEHSIPQYVGEYAKGHFDKVELVPSQKNGKVLTMQIVGVAGVAGGSWSGRKSLVVEGVLTENGKQIGNFLAERTSGRAYRGTCALLGRSAKAIGKDVGEWLEKPTKGARLGDAR